MTRSVQSIPVYLFLLLSIMFLVSCGAHTVPIEMGVAAESREASNLKKIAVMRFNGQSGKLVSAKLEAALASAKDGADPVFEVASAQWDTEQSRQFSSNSPSGFNRELAQRIGGNLNVDAVYGGDVMTWESDTDHYSETRRRGTNCKGKGIVRKCSSSQEYSVSCVRTSAKVVLAVSVLNTRVKPNRIAFSTTEEGAYQTSSCDGGVPSSKDLLDRALEDAVRKIRRKVAPYQQKMDIVLKTRPKNLVGEKKAEFEKAIKWAEAADFERACEIWRDIDKSGSRDPFLYYNIAICDEKDGKLTQAQARAREAKDLLQEPDDEIIALVQRLEQKRSGVAPKRPIKPMGPLEKTFGSAQRSITDLFSKVTQ